MELLVFNSMIQSVLLIQFNLNAIFMTFNYYLIKMVSAAVVGKAILENPKKFANAFKTTLEATGNFLEKAIKVADSARHLIATTKLSMQ